MTPTIESLQESERYASALNQGGAAPDLSFVIPVMNEEETLQELVDGIHQNVPEGLTAEIIFIDDGSTDSSWDVIQALADLHPGQVTGIRFRANRGKAAGLQTGFDAARGEIVFTMDADLQDDPEEIPRFLAKLEEGYDLVSGWKQVRHDPWHKVFPSRVFNKMLSYFSGVSLHDHNCGFKCYRRMVVKNVQLFGELHRMVPSLAGIHGFRVSEISVTHHPRKHGVSKYGIERFIRGFSDMLTVGFLRVYRERPAHFANTAATAYAAVSFLVFASGLIAGFTTVAGVLCTMTSLLFLGFSGCCVVAGLLSELMIRQKQRTLSPVLTDTEAPQASQSNTDAKVIAAVNEKAEEPETQTV
ncbi:MAG: glycosyltransferase family 2 protein [Planctomycetota bacterium]